MARGNWQRRIELADARKAESKQLKKKRNNRSHNKTSVQGLLDFLEKHAAMIRNRADPSWVLHLWTDTIPSDSPSLIDLVDNDRDGGGKRRPRVNSIAVESQKNGEIKKTVHTYTTGEFKF